MKQRALKAAAIVVIIVATMTFGAADFTDLRNQSPGQLLGWSAQWREREFIRPHQDTELLSMLTRHIAEPARAESDIAAARGKRTGQLTLWMPSDRGD